MANSKPFAFGNFAKIVVKVSVTRVKCYNRKRKKSVTIDFKYINKYL